MIYRKLGRTGLDVSIFGMGTGGSGDPLGQKSGVPESEIHRLLHRAYDLGINYFDTAPGYMESEVILGRALEALPRERVIVSTKIALAGSMPGQPIEIMKPEAIEQDVDTSLRRLGMDHIDLLLIAVAGPEHFDIVMNEHFPALFHLREKGKVRYFGSSEQSRSDGSHEWIQRLLPSNAIDVVMVAYNMINQSASRSVHPYCMQNDIGVINIFTVRNVFRNPDRLKEVIADLRERGLVQPDGVSGNCPLEWILVEGQASSMVEAAYRFAAYSKGVSTVMVGTLSIERLEENVRSIEKGPLAPETVRKLRTTFAKVAEPVGN